MVKLRLARMGNRKRPFYRVVAAEEAHRRDGRFIEILGTYDPLKQPAAVEVESEAVLKWLSNGAQPTDTVKHILAKAGVWAHWQAYKNGTAELDGMTGRAIGTVERTRGTGPSKKVTTKLAEEEAAKKAAEAAEVEAAAKAKADAAAAAAAAGAEESTEEAAS